MPAKAPAYKLLAAQEGLSHRAAKALIDAGLVSLPGGERVKIARASLAAATRLKIHAQAQPAVLFEDERLVAVAKPPGFLSEDLERIFSARLLHRLDRGTSGVILLSKDEEFRILAVEEFKKQRVEKSYLAVLCGLLEEEVVVDAPLLIQKSSRGARARVAGPGREQGGRAAGPGTDRVGQGGRVAGQGGLAARSVFSPLAIQGRRTLVRVSISTGRTHQIRAHAAYIKHPVLGDERYGAKLTGGGRELFLHSERIALLGLEFRAGLEGDFAGFEDWGR